MKIHADLSLRAFADTPSMPWVPSPEAGVHRKMLDRDGQEVARATSIVRFDPGHSFSFHMHGLGEEFLVLDGVFSDEEGDYPAGTYVRNPPGSHHAPSSPQGCTIFVKLRQMKASDTARVVIDTHTIPPSDARAGMTESLLYHNSITGERVTLLRLEPGSALEPHSHPHGEELLVLEGACEDDQGEYSIGTWLRNPAGSQHQLRSRLGCTLWMKTGHLG